MDVSRETIAAIATPLGTGGVGVVRVSGPRSLSILNRLFRAAKRGTIRSHKMLYGWLVDPVNKKKIDQVLACYMKRPRTFTGEDVVEFYCHGSPAVLQNVLGLTLDLGARLAERGEFTKRSFLNNKMDLTQAEAVLDLVSSASAWGAGLAVRQLEGRLSETIIKLRQQLLQLLAGLEAEIDFPDDVPELNRRSVSKLLSKLGQTIDQLLAGAKAGRIFRHGLAVAIIGRPNVGKSSLLNALLEEQRAIVAKTPGTTRDTIVEALEVKGISFRLADTAGIRQPRDGVEALGVARAEDEARAAGLVLLVLDGSKALTKQDKAVIHRIMTRSGIIVLNKTDLGLKIDRNTLNKLGKGLVVAKTSAITGAGIAQLRQRMAKIATNEANLSGDDPIYINARHHECLKRAKFSLLMAETSCNKGLPADFISIDIKAAVLALGEITGELVSDEIIHTIFNEFCVGK